MKSVLKLFGALAVAITLGLGMSGCGGSKVSPEVQESVKNQEKVYTKHGMFITYGQYGQKYVYTTNYCSGQFIPVNSEVTYQDINKKQVKFSYNGMSVMLRNMPKHSKTDMNQMMSRYFSKTKVNLSKFTKSERKAIDEGRVETGMSKEAVLLARGYPPAHKTPSIKSDSWRYWVTRYNTQLVEFKNNRVSKIID